MTTAKPKVAFYWCESCGGCKETVVDLNDAILDVAAAVDIVFWPVALDFKRKDVEAIPGCPPTPELLADAVKAVLSGTLPPRGAVLAPDRAVCDTCPRKDTRPDKLLLSGFRRPHEIEIDEEKCFLGQTLPCLGSATRGGWGQLCLIAPDIGNRHPHNHAALHIGRELDVVGGPKAAVPHLHHAGVGIGRRHPRGMFLLLLLGPPDHAIPLALAALASAFRTVDRPSLIIGGMAVLARGAPPGSAARRSTSSRKGRSTTRVALGASGKARGGGLEFAGKRFEVPQVGLQDMEELVRRHLVVVVREAIAEAGDLDQARGERRVSNQSPLARQSGHVSVLQACQTMALPEQVPSGVEEGFDRPTQERFRRRRVPPVAPEHVRAQRLQGFEVGQIAAGQVQTIGHDLEVHAARRHDVATPKRSRSIARWRGSNSAAFRNTTSS
jgi:hypothetical protein